MSLFTSPVGPGMQLMTQERGQDLQFQAQMAEVGVREKALGVEKEVAKMQMSHQQALEAQRMQAEQQMLQQRNQLELELSERQRAFLAEQENKMFGREREMFDLEQKAQVDSEARQLAFQESLIEIQTKAAEARDRVAQSQRRDQLLSSGMIDEQGKYVVSPETLAYQQELRSFEEKEAEMTRLQARVTGDIARLKTVAEREIQAVTEIGGTATQIAGAAGALIGNTIRSSVNGGINGRKAFGFVDDMDDVDSASSIPSQLYSQYRNANPLAPDITPLALNRLVYLLTDTTETDDVVERKFKDTLGKITKGYSAEQSQALTIFLSNVIGPYFSTLSQLQADDTGIRGPAGSTTIVGEDGETSSSFEVPGGRTMQNGIDLARAAQVRGRVGVSRLSRMVPSNLGTVQMFANSFLSAITSGDTDRMRTAVEDIEDIRSSSPVLFEAISTYFGDETLDTSDEGATDPFDQYGRWKRLEAELAKDRERKSRMGELASRADDQRRLQLVANAFISSGSMFGGQ